jgi:hypothetical protein
MSKKKRLLSIEDAINRIKEEFPNDIEFALTKRSEIKGNLFRDFDRLYRGLRFLATTYLKSKRGVVPCKDLPKVCKDECGFSLQHHYPYETCYEGRKLELHGHIKRGWWKNKQGHIRIAFEYLADRQIVVVGHIG